MLPVNSFIRQRIANKVEMERGNFNQPGIETFQREYIL